MDPVIDKAKGDLAEAVAQIAKLSAEVARLTDLQKKLTAFLEIYGEAPLAPAATLTRPLPPTNLRYTPVELHRPSFNVVPTEADVGTAKARITGAVARILSDGIPRQTRTLLEELKKEGLEPGSTDKIIGLSNLLSKDERFVADRSVGWSLKK